MSLHILTQTHSQTDPEHGISNAYIATTASSPQFVSPRWFEREKGGEYNDNFCFQMQGCLSRGCVDITKFTQLRYTSHGISRWFPHGTMEKLFHIASLIMRPISKRGGLKWGDARETVTVSDIEKEGQESKTSRTLQQPSPSCLSFSSQFFSTEQEERQHPQTGQEDRKTG